MNTLRIIRQIRTYFNIMPDKQDEKEIIDGISKGVSFRGVNLWVLIFAIFTASLGLNVNSTAVIIGAMLISPLMGPIIGMGLAVGINDLELLKRAAKNFGVATLISVLTAMFYFLVTPLGEAQSELLARTSPTIYDVLIATCGGAAGILALCTKGNANVIPGVAIATALMPPLCTAGYGLATGHLLYFLGAFYLFFINTVFISLATYVGVRLMHFHRQESLSPEKAQRTRRIVMGLAVLTMIPAALMTVGIVKRSIFENNLSKFIKLELSQAGTQVISNQVDEKTATLEIVAVGKEISAAKQAEAVRRMEEYGLKKYQLNIIQGEQSDSVLQLNYRLNQINSSRENDRKQMVELSMENARLKEQLAAYTRLEDTPANIREELKALFPQLKTLSMARVGEASTDTTAVRRFAIAVVSTEAKAPLSSAERQRLRDFLKARTKVDSLVVCMK